MITKKFENCRYEYYDEKLLLFSINPFLETFFDYALIYQNNNYILAYKRNYVWYNITSFDKIDDINIIYFLKINIIFTNTINYILDLNFDIIGNGYDDIIKYALNQIRIQKLKTLV